MLLTALILFLFYFIPRAQDSCIVKPKDIQGTYSGGCVHGKAEGNGKAIGIDSYDGNFKNGYPDGEGKYTWSNGNIYTGNFKKGQKEGKGMLIVKRQDSADKKLEGYWKKDVYIGEYENPYIIHSFTTEVARINVDTRLGKGNNSIEVVLENTSSNSVSLGSITPHLKLTDIKIAKGSYNLRTDVSKYKEEVTTLGDIVFPFRAVFYIDNNSVDVEFFTPGTYTLNIYINK